RSSPRSFFPHAPRTEICTLSLHDALPIFSAGMGALYAGITVVTALPQVDAPTADAVGSAPGLLGLVCVGGFVLGILAALLAGGRSEEHTSELQSRFDLVCRLLLEKKNKGL